MHLDQDSPWLVAVALCGCAAMGIAAYGIGSGTLSTSLLSASIIALGLGLVLAQMRAHFRGAAIEEMGQDLHMMARRVDIAEQQSRDWQFGQEGLSQQISALRADTSLAATQLTHGLESIRQSHASIAQQIQSLLSQPMPQPADSYAPKPAATSMFSQMMGGHGVNSSHPVHTLAEARPVASARLVDRLTLSLEPVIDLYTMQTAHYRMIVSMLNDSGEEVAPEYFATHAAQMGERAEIDLFVFREALGILGTLRQRDANLCVITSIGAQTLADPSALRTIIDMMLERRETSAGLVIEVSHDVLASLSDASLEGLALLARAGIALAFASASIAGADLGALSKLNVRYVSLEAATLSAGEQASSALGGFVQAARALRIQIIITEVNDARQMQQISRTARYAAGRSFAQPRRLKREDDSAPTLRAVA